MSLTTKLKSSFKSVTSRQLKYFSSTSANAQHPWLRHSEKQTEVPVSGTVVKGQIPEWLQGHLIRNGPGIMKVGDTHYNHLFDGLSVLHKFTIKDGKALYQSRALESDAYKMNVAANRIVVSEFGTYEFPDPCQSILGRYQSKFMSLIGQNSNKLEMTDNCSVNVAYIGDQLYAMTETVFVHRVDPETLKCKGDKTRLRNYCALNTATAHPHMFPDGSILNVGNNFRHSKGPHYMFVKVPPSYGEEETAFKKAKIIGEIPSRWKWNPAYFHSFGMTKDKIIFVESPLCLNIFSVLGSPVSEKSFYDCMKWHENEKTRIYVLSMEDGKLHPIVYETENLFLFHHINAYEENGNIILDVAGYKDAKIVDSLKFKDTDKIESSVAGGSARRYILPLNTKGADTDMNLIEATGTKATAFLRKGSKTTIDVTPHHFTSDFVELPRINYDYNGAKYNYFYCVRATDKTTYSFPVPDKITKINIKEGTALDYLVDYGMVAEPVFIANPQNPNAAEDDGVLLTTVMHKNDPSTVSLLILNAKDLSEISRTDFKASGTVSGTFHGLWASQ